MSGIKKYLKKKLNNTQNKSTVVQTSKSIDNHLKEKITEDNRTLKLLLLGAGGSGKSTIMKQMDRMYNKNITELLSRPEYQQTIVEMVHKNIIHDTIDLCKQFLTLKSQISDLKFEDSELEDITIRIASEFTIITNYALTINFAADVEKLWSSPVFRRVFEIRKKSHIMDNTPYFFNNIMKYASIQYLPSFEDYVRVREQTTGISSSKFVVQGLTREWIFHAIDVGGQRAERRKWMKVFDNINVVLYVMSLAAYDQVLYEDNSQRCWDETFSLFDQTITHKAFKKTDFIVFLNKRDIFADKIQNVSFMTYINGEKDALSSLSNMNFQSLPSAAVMNRRSSNRKVGMASVNSTTVDSFSMSDNIGCENDAKHSNEDEGKWEFDETEGNSETAVILWAKKRFLDIFYASHGGKERYIKQRIERQRTLHFHVTCATDEQQIETVVNIVKLQMLRRFLNRNFVL